MTFLAKVERFGSMQAYYDGATSGRRGASIRRSNADANVISYSQGPRLRKGARDLVRNNAHARRAVEAIVANTIGNGITPHFTRDQGEAEDIEALAKRSLFTTQIDSDGRLDYFGLQALALQATAEGGEVLVRRRWRRPSDGFVVPVQFQILEPEYLDDAKDGPVRGGGRIIQGVEFDAIGRRRGYWLYRDHPGGRHFTADSSFVPAADVIHMYRPDRPGQVRGIPWAAPVMLKHADFADYEEAQLVRQKIAACFAAFVTEPFDTSVPGSVEENAAGELIDTMEPGIIERLPPGTEISFADPPGVENYAEYSNVSLHTLAMGWGISYEMLTGDLRGVNFASGKMGHMGALRNFERWQRHMVIPQLCEPLVGWWLEAAAIAGANITGVRTRHIAPRHEMVDPPKEIKAQRDALRSGQKTFTQVIRESGRDPAEHFRELAADFKLLDENGIVLDSDPRWRTNAGLGIAQTSIQPGDEGDDEMDDEEIEAVAARVAGLLASRNGSHP